LLTIDGASGGGQVVRTAATFAALTGRSVAVTDVRGARDDPGLKRQHVAALEAVAAACDADLSGATVGSTRVAIDPGALVGGEASIAVGTAGSLTLVFDAVLPLAARLEAPYRVTVTGGTDVQWAPPFDYLRFVKLPLLRDAGLDATASLSRRGFYPSGGGEATLTVRPSALAPVERTERGTLERVSVRSVASEGLREVAVAERQAETAVESIRETAVAPVVGDASYAESDSPGSVVTVAADYASSRAGFSALGARGKPSERVAAEVVEAFERFERGSAAVDGHLADQLLPFLALAEGAVVAPERTAHLDAQVAVVDAFGYQVRVAETDDGTVRITVG